MKEKLLELQDGWFHMDTMMTFPRLRSLTQNSNFVLGSRRGRIKRSPNKPLPELNEARQIATASKIGII